MGELLDKLADFLNFDRFSNVFRDHEETIMTRGLRVIAIGCVIVALAYAVIAYLQFKAM